MWLVNDSINYIVEMCFPLRAYKFSYWLTRLGTGESEVIHEKTNLEVCFFEGDCVLCAVYFSLRFEQGYCYFGTKCTFAHGREELEAWCEFDKHQAQNLAQLEEKRLLTESFSEKVRQRIQKENRGVVSRI